LTREEAELLKKRALDMLKAAKSQMMEGALDLAAFLAEQAAQLYLKSVVLRLVGEIPRTHSVRELLAVLKQATGSPEVEGFARRHRASLSRLESAYINSRYLPKSYELEEVKELVKIAEEVVSFAERLPANP